MTSRQPEPGPPPGYDVERVVALARAADPGLPEQAARELAVLAGDHLRSLGAPDAPEVARRLLADRPDVGATPTAVVARAAADHCRADGVALA